MGTAFRFQSEEKNITTTIHSFNSRCVQPFIYMSQLAAVMMPLVVEGVGWKFQHCYCDSDGNVDVENDIVKKFDVTLS